MTSDIAQYNFAYLDEQTKRMIRRAILKGIAIPGYQVPFASREMPMPYGWGTGGVQVTASIIGPDDTLKVIDQGADDTTNAVSIRRFFQRTAGVATTEATAEAIVDGWFHTGDGGVMSDDAYVTISDRKKDVIISGGENVSSIEVEDALFSHPDVTEAAVIGVPHEKWGETVKGLVVLAPGSTVTEAELIEYCRTRIAHYKCPTSIEVRDELARTATGKLQKFKLRAPYWEGMERQIN